MSENNNPVIVTIEARVKAPVQKVWEYFNAVEHVTKWNQASPDWHSPYGENDLREGGRFSYRMEAKDGSFGFDFGGKYDVVTPFSYIEYTMDDGRKVKAWFREENGVTTITEKFDAETQNPVEMQQQGWQSILDSFRKYTESNCSFHY
ncbi:MAG: SRPBCC family protein [Ferruginibacter sp.]